MIIKKKIKKLKNLLFNPQNIIKFLTYNEKNDFKQNVQKLKDLDCNIDKIKINLEKANIDFYDKRLSWHYHFFAGLNIDGLKFLEIGTYDGKFANFISNCNPNAEIHTIDLKFNDEKFINSYDREDKEFRNKFLTLRENNLKRNNIFFYELDSINILHQFKKDFFDIIWIDGDHHAPQVVIDIYNSLKLLKANGIICCDDVIKFPYKDKKVSNESFETLKILEKNNTLKNDFILKRINKNNIFLRKYISVSKKN